MGWIFGAYTDIPWSSKTRYKKGNGNTFVFSLRDDFNFVKLKCMEIGSEVYHNKDYLTSIGNREGFCIVDECNIHEWNCSRLGNDG